MLSKSSERAMIETNLVVKVVLGLAVGGNCPVVRSLPFFTISSTIFTALRPILLRLPHEAMLIPGMDSATNQ
jgi:hypothetical protein